MRSTRGSYGIRTDISVFLNLTPDHLDRHHTLELYAKAKRASLRTSAKKTSLF